MNWKNANRFFVLVTAIVVIIQITWWFPRLPQIVPSHFDAAGNVDGTMSKVAFCGLIGSLQVLFLVGFPLLSGFLKQIPDSLINVPHKDYWLAPVRRETTLEKSGFVLNASGWITSWLMIGIFQLSALVGIGARAGIMPEFLWMMVGYLGLVFGMVGFMMWQFKLPADSIRSAEAAPKKPV